MNAGDGERSRRPLCTLVANNVSKLYSLQLGHDGQRPSRVGGAEYWTRAGDRIDSPTPGSESAEI